MKFDSIIIGFGKAGKTLAGYLATKGEKVALIEKDKNMYGGTCINVGCIPSKSLVTSSNVSKIKAKTLEDKEIIYVNSINEKERVTSFLRQKNYDKLFANKNIEIIDGTASFVDKYKVNIKQTDKDFDIEGEKIFINTGSTSVVPNIPGINNNPFVFYSDSLMKLKTLPHNLVIIGGGYIGLEFASIYSNFGSKVTVIQDMPQFIGREDREIADAIYNSFIERGIEIVLGAKISNVSENKVNYSINGVEFVREGDAILVATGRKPNIEDLHLERIGIELTPRGAIKVNDHLESSIPNIYALGDVNGGLQFTYVSLDDFRVVKNHLEGKDSYNISSRKNVPYSVFITPSFSRIGLTEKEAIDQGFDVKTAKMPVAAIPKAQVLKETTGLLKAVVDAKTNKILGVSLFCSESYEMINIIKLAMDLDAPYTVLRDQVFTHPTMSESLNDLFSLIK